MIHEPAYIIDMAMCIISGNSISQPHDFLNAKILFEHPLVILPGEVPDCAPEYPGAINILQSSEQSRSR